MDEIIDRNGSKNLGFKTERLQFDKKDKENVFSKSWRNENKKSRGLGFGQGILQNLFFSVVDNYHQPTRKLIITNRDRFVTATAIQWLGTNVGFCWLRETLAKAGYDVVKRKKEK